MTKVKVEKVTKINLKIISKPRALLQTQEKTCAKFQKTGLKLYEKLQSQGLRSENDRVQKVEEK